MNRDFYSDLIKSPIPKIMGIVNVTPDSFSDGGNYFNSNQAIKHGLNLIEDGADIIDIGGESTRPGAQKVSEEQELERVIPVIEGIIKDSPDTLISIDTNKSEVAKQAIESGAKIINDISAASFDPNILNIASEYNVPYVLMHMQGDPSNMQDNPKYDYVVEEVYNFLEIKIDMLHSKGITQIIIDPGIGFGKTVHDNYKLLKNLNKFSNLNFPILLGVSKKSFLGNSLNLKIEERENATIIAETIGVLNGAKIIRTHNVKNAFQLKNIYSNIS
jgi:dihydropteroate synthase